MRKSRSKDWEKIRYGLQVNLNTTDEIEILIETNKVSDSSSVIPEYVGWVSYLNRTNKLCQVRFWNFLLYIITYPLISYKPACFIDFS